MHVVDTKLEPFINWFVIFDMILFNLLFYFGTFAQLLVLVIQSFLLENAIAIVIDKFGLMKLTAKNRLIISYGFCNKG